MDNKRKDKMTVIMGGGTFSYVRNHLSLATPAFGTTAKLMYELIPNSYMVLTKMADSNSRIITNDDVEIYIDSLLEDRNVGTIIFNVAMCDFNGIIDGGVSGKYGNRLKTSEGTKLMELTPALKIINKIRIKRPDIFLVGFKTTCCATSDEQFSIALQFMKKSKCNLVLANDVDTRNNMIIVPEETSYYETTNRTEIIYHLVRIIRLRQNLTYTNTVMTVSTNTNIKFTSVRFNEVIRYLVDNNAFKIINGNAFTPGHFCYRVSMTSYLSSQRKVDHNNVFNKGLTKVRVIGSEIHAKGTNKPSVGFTSQLMLFDKYEDLEFDCIIHTHNPLKENSKIPIVSQLPYQCGSMECAINTRNGMKLFNNGKIGAVYLGNHGVNIIFSSTIGYEEITSFISDNIDLSKPLR